MEPDFSGAAKFIKKAARAADIEKRNVSESQYSYWEDAKKTLPSRIKNPDNPLIERKLQRKVLPASGPGYFKNQKKFNPKKAYGE